MQKIPRIPDATLIALANGAHGAPFDVLGAHAFGHGVVVRAYRPATTQIQLLEVDCGKKHAMQAMAVDGFYECYVDGVDAKTFFYELLITTPSGEKLQHPDLYAFPSQIRDYDSHLMGEGKHKQIYTLLGAHLVINCGHHGVRFAVWAPNARSVAVIGDFNGWVGAQHVMRYHSGSGIWELFIPGLTEGTLYKYEIKSHYPGSFAVQKTDPVGFYAEIRPNTASVVWHIDKHRWQDESWLAQRATQNHHAEPINMYELHLGSWRRNEDDEWLTYDELADILIPYILEMGYTHIELMPITEFPYDGSWGYQVLGYFAPTSRYGTPEQFQHFIDRCHQANIGVILDWVPAHFPKDAHGLGLFDGTHLYEHADPRQGEHPDWGTYIFNYGRNEVRQFLINSALFWMEKYHIDGVRVDAVASMLYLDYSREAGQWKPNILGGRENLEAIDFIRQFNTTVHERFPGALTIAEESTSWPGVTHPIADGGLGFDFKWNMGWMHDTLKYLGMDPIFRAHHHGTLTFSLMYAFSEKFILPFSHDEVVHLKKSMADKMWGDSWQKFAQLRLLYAYQIAHPGKKLHFMGGEFGQWREWSEERSLDWHLVHPVSPQGLLQKYVAIIGKLYQDQTPLHENDDGWDGFEWLDVHNYQHSVLSFVRRDAAGNEIIAIFNFTPVVREAYRIASAEPRIYTELLNSDDPLYGGSGITNEGELATEVFPWRGKPHSIALQLPPLGAIFLQYTHLTTEEPDDKTVPTPI